VLVFLLFLLVVFLGILISMFTDYKPLNNKELLQHQLTIIHSHTEQKEWHYMKDIRANIAVKWESTVKQLENIRRQQELQAIQ